MSMQRVKFNTSMPGMLMMYSSDNPRAGGRYGGVSLNRYEKKKPWQTFRFFNSIPQETLYFSKRRHAKKALQKWGQPQ